LPEHTRVHWRCARHTEEPEAPRPRRAGEEAISPGSRVSSIARRTRTSVYLTDGRHKSIRHYHGNDEAPRALTDVENRIESFVAEWVGKR
jgi:hypothetical protein